MSRWGSYFYDLNLPDAAIKHLSVAVSLDSLNGDAWLYLGYAYEARFSFSLSEEDLRRAARAYQSGAIVNLQNAHFRAGLRSRQQQARLLGIAPTLQVRTYPRSGIDCRFSNKS